MNQSSLKLLIFKRLISLYKNIDSTQSIHVSLTGFYFTKILKNCFTVNEFNPGAIKINVIQ